MSSLQRLSPFLFAVVGALITLIIFAVIAPELLIPGAVRSWVTFIGVLLAGLSLTTILASLAQGDGTAMNARMAGGQVTTLRPIAIPEAPVAVNNTVANNPLLRLDAMVGLTPVKSEVRSLIARANVDAQRRNQGQAVTAVSQHMVFTGPPGVGKTEVARILGTVFQQMRLLRKGHLVETDRAGLVAGYVGQTAARTLDKCREALDGILFIDEAYTLAGEGNDFGREAIDTLLKFMEDNRDRIVVIVAGYPHEMSRFIAMNPGLAGRFTRHIDFPSYSAPELAEILKRMATAQGFKLPASFDNYVVPWVQSRQTRPDWANAREMRSLLERAREAQALRIISMPGSDINELTQDDLFTALQVRR